MSRRMLSVASRRVVERPLARARFTSSAFAAAILAQAASDSSRAAKAPKNSPMAASETAPMAWKAS